MAHIILRILRGHRALKLWDLDVVGKELRKNLLISLLVGSHTLGALFVNRTHSSPRRNRTRLIVCQEKVSKVVALLMGAWSRGALSPWRVLASGFGFLRWCQHTCQHICQHQTIETICSSASHMNSNAFSPQLSNPTLTEMIELTAHVLA